MDDQREFFECQCHGMDHTIRFMFFAWKSDDQPEVYITSYMKVHDRWYKRVWTALKYVFQRKVVNGYFSDTFMRHEDVSRLRQLCEKFEEYCKEQEAKNKSDPSGKIIVKYLPDNVV